MNAQTIHTRPVEDRSAGRGIFRRGLGLARTFVDMVRDRSYSFPGKLKMLSIICVLYLISPIDLIPDFIPMLGFADDISMLLGTLMYLVREIEKYQKREI